MSSNVVRQLVGGRHNQIGTFVRDSLTRGDATPFQRGVVIDILSDPASLTREEKRALSDSLSNGDYLDFAPPDSLIVRLVGGNQDGVSPLPQIVYPFFQSHIILPVQAGEQVWVLFDDIYRNGMVLGRWLTRCHENDLVEDLNFTHSDRQYIPANTGTTQAPPQSNSQPERLFFPNGGGNVDSYTLFQRPNDQNPYELIYNNSDASRLHTYGPVPRWKRRPQELVLQGMNNALVVLGQDRNGPFSPKPTVRGHAGSIDLVTGRGRFPNQVNTTTPSTDRPTSPYLLNNTRNYEEVNKRQPNPNEGNPDFRRDAARLIVLMNSRADENFGLTNSANGPQRPQNYPTNSLPIRQPQASNEAIGSSYVVGKADHVRMIARRDQIPGGGEIKGTLALVKEGTVDQDLSYLFFDEEGRVQLEGKKVFLGKAATADPNSNDHAEPYIKWSVYNEQINALKTEIRRLSDLVKEISDLQSTAFANSAAAPYTPVPSLVFAGNTGKIRVDSVTTQVGQNLDQIDPATAKSQKIFGE